VKTKMTEQLKESDGFSTDKRIFRCILFCVENTQ